MEGEVDKKKETKETQLYLGNAAFNPVSPYLEDRNDLGSDSERCGVTAPEASAVPSNKIKHPS